MKFVPAVVPLAIALILAAPPLPAQTAFMMVVGAKQGWIKGSVTQKGREGQIFLIQTSHEIVSPRDPASGLPTGKRQHKPFVVMKDLDQSTPLLYSALVTNENLTTVEIKFWRPSPIGGEVQHFTVRLTNASIASIKTVHPDVRTDLTSYKEYDEIAFTYQKIEWIWTDGGITASDDWESPVN